MSSIRSSAFATVRVVEGAEEIARHGRSYDTGATIEDPAHLDRLLTATRQAKTVLLDTLVQAELDARARRRLERQLQAARS